MREGFVDFFPNSASLTHIDNMFGSLVSTAPTAVTDQAVAKLASRGIRTMLILSYAGRSYDDFAFQVRHFAYKFKANPNLIALRLGNEPNHKGFGGFSADIAAKYIRIGVKAASYVGWDKPLLVGGPGGPYDNRIPYLRAMYKAGIPNKAHLAIHPYPRSGDSDYLGSVEAQIVDSRKILQNRSGHGKLWISEVGYSTAEFGEGEQAERLVRTIKLCREKRIMGTTIFRYADGPPSEDTSDWVKYLGVTKFDYIPKQAWFELKKTLV